MLCGRCSIGRSSLLNGAAFHPISCARAEPLGRFDEAFRNLHAEIPGRSALLASIYVKPRLDPLRADPWFEEFRQAVRTCDSS